MAFLEVKDLTRIYGKKENQLIALDHVSFSIEKGQFIAVTGASGSGKSTLLNLLGTMDDAQEGTVRLEGEDILGMKEKQKAIFRRRKIGFVFQEYNLVPVLNVEENIQIPVRLDGKQMNPEYLEKLLHILGLEERRYNLPEELSGGQKQRVAIGRALANHPSLILADEPTGNLDHQNGLEVMALLKESVQQFALTLIVVNALESEKMKVVRASDCEMARKLWEEKQGEYDLVLLDIMLPDGDGFSLCEWMKSQRADVPVIFLTALEDEGNVVHGLQYGDDYISKPFRTKELVARIYANIRKYRGIHQADLTKEDRSAGIIRNGELTLDEGKMLVFHKEKRLELTLSEYRLFQAFMHNVGRILTREQLMDRLWSVDGAFVDDNTLSVYVRRLRQKLEQGENRDYIKTIRGVGYRMEEER